MEPLVRSASQQPRLGTIRVRAIAGFVTLLAAAVLMLVGVAAPVAALDDLSPTDVSEAKGDACPELTRIKYPWLACRGNEHGGTTLALPSQPAPRTCNLRLANGECAASPRPWQLPIPVIGPGE